MILKHEQIQQIDIIRNAFKRGEGRNIDDQEAVAFALSLTSDILNIPQAEDKEIQ